MNKAMLTQARADYPCEVCEGETYEKHCKIICKNCGFKIDCSDHI